MMKRFFSTIIIAAIALCSGAQTPQNIRYVCNNNAEVKKADGTTLGYHVKGKYENDGRSWATAKENIQDAINDLVANGLTGEVWVAEGTYTPTESTESSGGSTLYMSFKIPAGITVRGGFHGLLTTTQDAAPTVEANIAKAGESNANAYHKDDNPSGREMNSTTSSSIGESTKYRTTLSGTLNNTQDPSFEWNDSKGQFDTQFYGNCYHVVYFATNGFDENGRAKALVGSTPAETATALSTPQKGETEGAGYVAKLEGVIVKNGNAKNTALEGHPHNAYGGGVYMVPGSMVENIYFTNCEASRDGGAIYMDGGGIVRHCYIADCQALGTDLTSGYGGGLCADENKQLYPTQVTRTTVANCVARYGGGMASKVNNPSVEYKTPSHNYSMKYNNGFGSNLITNCTATTEGGGAYSLNGGAWTHMTIVNNRCNGSGVTINGMKTGQSAGLYVRDDAIVGNTILWGGKTKAANDEAKSAQFALSRSTSSAVIDVRYTALSNVDNTNWSGVKKDNVIKLSNYNTHSAAETAGVTEPDGIKYPYFIHPSTTVGYETNGAALNYIPCTKGASTPDGYNYKVSYGSAASYAGILTNDLDYEDKTPAKEASIDIQGNKFGVYPSLGAYISEEPGMAPSIEYNTTLTNGETGKNIAHVYVDPNNTYAENAQYCGSSWNTPIKNLSDALSKIEQKIPALLPYYTHRIDEIQIHVKEGTVDMSGILSEGSVRSGSLKIPAVNYTWKYNKTEGNYESVTPAVVIMGGYDKSLDYNKDRGTSDDNVEYRKRHDLSKRNPILTPTVITGKVLNDYKYYIPHLVKIDGKKNVTIDGFQLRYANARSQELLSPEGGVGGGCGAAFTINNSTDITIKNVLVAGCTADNGAVLYATNSSTINFENCIFHNNETTYTETSGNIVCDATSSLTLDHCDILRNVGYPFYNLGTVTMTNSIVYANMSVPVEDTNSHSDKALVAFKGTGTYSGSTNLFDTKSEGKLPTGMNCIEPWLQFNFANGENDKYPFFCNPTKNAGVSVSGDDTYYGRATSFQPHNGNPAVNNASFTGTHDTWGTDMSTVITRDYGGRPDIGAIENHRAIEGEGVFGYSDGFPAYGTQWYVRDYGSDTSITGRDGMSWDTAINGNGLYDGVEGLQHAVNTAHDAFTTAGGTYGDEKEVWVGGGTYSRDPDSGETSCFVIKDGVKVYGAFPKTGNPGKEQREPLCSQYVKETKGRIVADYETILQPKTASTAAGTTHRVLGQPYASNPVNASPTTYLMAEWDGFTLRNGVLDASQFTSNSDRQGGAAATFYSNVILRNMVATGNTTFFNGSTTDSKLRGGAFYIDGGTLESSYVINNTLGSASGSGDGFGGGIYLYQGSVYNSVIANNTINAYNADGAGTAIFGQAISLGNNEFQITTNFFNNTVVNNTAKGSGRLCGGVAQVNTNTIKDEFDNQSLVNIYNCIVLDNTGYRKGNATLDGYKDFAVSIKGRMNINRCATENINDPKMTSQLTMSFTQCYATTSPSELFVNYNKSNTFDQQDFRLKATETSSNVINHGNSSPSVNGSTVDLGSYTDMDYKDRVLDCTIDMGAFEYDNAYDITPDLISESGRAIYYVTPEGLGVSSASSPEYAACADKLQRVLDAAGRYKYQHPEIQVIVKIATRKGGGNEEYVKPGSLASEDSGKDDLNTIADQKQYLNGLEMVVEQLDGSTQKVQALSGMTFNKKLSDMYQLGENTVYIYAGKKVTFNFQFPEGYGGSGKYYGKSCLVESVWIDTNGDKIFNQLLGRVGKAVTWTPNEDLKSVTYTIPEGMTGIPTRIRIRLETPWSINYTDANAQTNRIVYDIPIQVVNGTTNPASFQYYANRTVDEEDQDIRLWSIIVPRGVEVWGGYSDIFSTANQNGFYDKNSDGTYVGGKDKRDILGNPVYFDASYYNKTEGTSAVTYHVVSFADKVFDGNGSPYHQGDVIGEDAKAENSDKPLLTMTSVTTDRAVVDGIFIQGGTADANAGAASGSVNINQYGGAAIVTDYAHVRNCIVRDNKGFYGGAFALTHGALISGTLIEKNSADYGGAVYVFEDGTKLSNGTTVNTGTKAADNDKMPHIYTSTIVNNKAEKQGGGLWFTDDYSNVRVSSTVLWQNHCNDEANVYGLYSPEKADDQKAVTSEAFFPFAYSAIQNMRVSGTNNMSVETSNANGMRIWKQVSSGSPAGDTDMATDQAAFSDFGYWRPTSYSVLLNTGMPKDTYTELVTSLGLAATDFSAMDRLVGTARTYVDIGARALEKPLPNAHLMIRLFVAKPEDVDMNAAAAMMKLDKSKVQGEMTDEVKGDIASYYKQEGSSFAYPFQSLQDALDYVVACRSVNMQSNAAELISNCKDLDKAVDVPFEIYVAKGEYYPTKDLVGNYGESLSNTFAIPEGVAIYGGFNCLEQKTASENNYFGGYQSPKTTITKRTGAAGEKYDIWNNVVAPSDASGVAISAETLTFKDGDKDYNILLQPTSSLLESRPKEDINKNSIIEPWEFENQTVLSGNTTNESADGVYHVVSVLPDENIVGQLPPILTNAGYNYYAAYVEHESDPLHGYQPKETGQKVVLNGLTVSGGYAEDYKIGEMKDELSQYIYFKGGGLVADGNRYNNSFNEWVAKTDEYKAANPWTKATNYGYKHNNVTNNVAYHNVPIDIVNCKFRDNVAGFGGAIAANCEMLIYGSSFENNLALAGGDTFQKPNGTSVTVEYPGQGGAILNSYQFSAYNTLFANNEAQDSRNSLELKAYKTYDNQNPTGTMLGGAGGALYFGKHGYFHIFNCDIVRNKANAYPAIFTANPNYLTDTWKNGGQCMPGEYNLLENTVLWGNELNDKMSYPSVAAKYAARLVCNVGKKSRTATTDYSPAFTDGNIPTKASDLTSESDWMETAWFCAYEDGRGFPATNGNDMRALTLDPTKHIVSQLTKDNTGATVPYQNSNIIIDSENATLEGPNFGNPSQTAGNSGYREDSDWSPSRICNLTDNGSGKLDQRVGSDGEMEFYKADDKYVGSGTYWTARYQQINDNTATLPIGNEVYMHGAGTDLDILRISLDPNPTHGESYIDIGVYEYVHTKLEPTTIGDEVDILWVSNEEKYGNGKPDGKTWATPTSDLQRAIETLLASRNGHRKEVRLMEGEYSPVYTINGHQSFYIDTKYLNASVELPEDASHNPIEGKGVKSFTIKGGYSKDLMNQYDVTLYPSIIKTKTRSNATEDDWDHAIYIADASQRYGIKTGYEAVNGFGWWETEAKQQSKPAPTTVPIQIDGVSVVNNQALTTAKGAAIYYADQVFNAVTETENPGMQNDAGTILALAPASANITTSGDTDEATHTYATKNNPAKLILSKTHVYDSGAHDGSKSVSAVYIGKYGGEALIYNNVFHSNYGDPLVAYAAKTINNTYALNGGKVDLKNATGNSIYDAAHPYKSTIMNSALWRNNPTSGKAKSADAFGNQLLLNEIFTGAITGTGSSVDITNYADYKDYFKYNAYTGGNNEAVDYEDEGQFIKTHNHNVGLVNGNSDAIYGPNFADPENADVSKRSFKLLPSLRLLNKGSNSIYAKEVQTTGTAPDLTLQDATAIYEYAWVPTVMKDAAGQYRIMVKTGGVIDIGALEYQTQQNRILYVDPSKTLSGEGLSWGDALGYGNIQAAIDLAAVYYKNMHKEAYVFVKAAPATNKDMHTGETITLRNGVSIYGSVNSDFKENCNSSTDVSGNISYAEADIANYVKDVTIYNRGGIINPSSGQTRINGINTNGTAFDNTATCLDDGAGNAKLPTALVDGFVVTNAEAVKAPVIKIAPKIDDTQEATGGLKMCLRNIAVYGNDYSDGDGDNTISPNNNLVDINSALLYEVLMHSNKVADNASVLKVGANGYVVNATVEGKTTGSDGSTYLNNVGSGSAISDNSPASHVYNSITNYASDEATWKTLSGYCYKMEDQNLNYQLTENSKYIDACGTNNPMAEANLVTTEADRTALQGFINYVPVYEGTKASGKWTSADKDLLGNFRLQTLGGKVTGMFENVAYTSAVDRGAFETWKVVRSAECVYPDYPHDGSVEYIMTGKSLIIDPIAEDGDNRATAHVPGFILLQEGASLYGNGRPVHASYVALERKVRPSTSENGKGSIVSMPFSMDYVKSQVLTADANTTVGVATRTYNETTGVMEMTNDNGNVWKYDGSKRSDWKYAFASSNSPCWKAVSEGTVIPAAQGVLYEPSNTYNCTEVLRFTYRGNNLSDYIYNEESTPNAAGDRHYYQTVTLKKYDDSESTSGAADFTEAEDQGWNCIGLPYLVNDYSTMGNTTAEANVHGASASGKMMQNPHTMWLYYDGKKYPDDSTDANGDGGFYSVSSWDASDWHVSLPEGEGQGGACIWAGEGFFVQNQKFSGDETVTFYRPVAPTLSGTASASAKATFNTRFYVGDGITEIDNMVESRDDIDIKVVRNTLYVRNLQGGENIRLYTTAGQLIMAETATSDTFTTHIGNGVIIVSVDGRTKKVQVR